MLCIHRSRMMDMVIDFQGIVEIPPPDLFLINQLLSIVNSMQKTKKFNFTNKSNQNIIFSLFSNNPQKISFKTSSSCLFGCLRGMHLETLLQHGYSLLADCLIYFIIDCLYRRKKKNITLLRISFMSCTIILYTFQIIFYIINVEHIFHVIYNGWNLLEFSRFFAINPKLNVSLCI